MATAAALIRDARERLTHACVPSAAVDAEVLLAQAIGVDRVRLHVDPDQVVPPAAARAFEDLVGRRVGREPLQYLTGVQEFWSLPFHVSPAVLIPRPETEGIVEAFLAINRRPDPLVLDVGTGSGCLAVVVAREVPGARVLACDLSAEALTVARDNAARHGVTERVRFECGDIFDAFAGSGVAGQADFILSNPPYVPEGQLAGLVPEVRDHEPRTALVAGPDGLDVHRRLAAGAHRFLRPSGGTGPGGHLIVEFGLGQEPGIRAVYGPATGWAVVVVRADLAGIPRIAVVRAAG